MDTNEDLVKSINQNLITFGEPGVQPLLDTHKENLQITTNIEQAVLNTDVSFIIVPTHSNSEGGFSNQYILEAVRAIGSVLKLKSSHHTVVIMSTVIPGSSNLEIIPMLEQSSGKTVGDGIGYCYNPLFIAQGEIVKGIITPDYLLIGEHSENCGNIVQSIHEKLLENEAPIVRMNTTEAEITKLASNTHETMRVSFANMLAQACNEMPGTNVDNVTNALSFRLGKRFFKGATPYGGPCWPRDNVALSAVLQATNLEPHIPSAVHNFNQYHIGYLIENLQSLVDKGINKIGMVGIAYKVGTPLIEESFAIEIVNRLKGENLEFVVYDPLASDNFIDFFSDRETNVRSAENPNDCLEQTICLLLQPLEEIQHLDYASHKETIIIDYWRVIPEDIQNLLPNYQAFGINPCEEKLKSLESSIKGLTN